VLAVWKVDTRGRLSTICPYRRPATGGVTHAIFRTAGQQKRVVTSAFAAADCPPFYFGGELGNICHGDDLGHCNDSIVGLGSAIAAMLYYAEKDLLIIITRLHMLAQYKLTDNKPTKILMDKLSIGKEGVQAATWAGPGLLALVSADQVIRFSDLANDNNYVLSLADVPSMDDHLTDKMVSLAHHKEKHMLAAATREGRLLIWKQNVAAPIDAAEKSWTPLAPVHLESKADHIAWSGRDTLLATSSSTGLYLLPQTVLHRSKRGNWSLIQLNSNKVQLEHIDGAVQFVETPMRISGADLHDGHVVLWSGTQVEVFRFNETTNTTPPIQVSHFDAKAAAVGIWGEHLYICGVQGVYVANFAGSVVANMPFSEAEGEPRVMHIAGSEKSSYVAAGTDKGVIKVWDISRREPRQHTAGRKLNEGTPSRVTSIQVSSDGARISATLEVQPPPQPPPPGTRAHNAKPPPPVWMESSKLWVYFVDVDVLAHHDFGESGRVPNFHMWEQEETKLLCVQTRPSSFASVQASDVTQPELEVVTIFATPLGELKMHNSIPVDEGIESLLAVRVPHVFFVTSEGGCLDGQEVQLANRNGRIVSKVMREFVGMEDADAQTQHALIDFSYYLTIGNMDEAHRAVKLIKNASVWENMAKMCVKTKRLDVAEICLGNMGHARGARAVRDVIAQYTNASGRLTEPEVCAAMVAIQLGLIEDAERLYASCGRHDLLNNLYQASGQWEKALKVAEEKDRIHLKATHYTYAKQLEASGNTSDAVRHFELSGTHRAEVPRMLFDAQQMSQLQSYVDSSQDNELLRWWAQFAESNGQFDKALQYYERAADHLAIVRVLCFHDKLDRAAEIVNGSSDLGAAYHLAKQYEAKGDVKQAIYFFQRSQRFNHAIRLAKQNDMAGELTMLSLHAPAKLMIEAAEYFESRNMPEKAVTLYQKGGNLSKAIDLCFRSRLFGALRDIAQTLDSDTDPQLLHRCAEFFLDHGQYDRTVHLFTVAGEYSKALDLCVLHNLPLSEQMAEKMLPALGDRGAETEELRNALLAKVGKVLKRQGNFHLACKKYTQAGDKVKAMKCLLKSGDTEKIVFFAGVSRSRDIYILAANHLQTLDWHSDSDIVKNIVSFYTKAKAFEQLSSFYDACAQVEIDEYRDYEKALVALKEALTWLDKGRFPGKEQKVASLQARISHVETFVGARKLVKSDPQQMVKRCHELLEQIDVESAIRVGDVYALMVEWFYAQHQMDQAYSLIEKMRARSIILSPYLDQEMVQAICTAVGMPVAQDPAPLSIPTEDTVAEAIDEIEDDD